MALHRKRSNVSYLLNVNTTFQYLLQAAGRQQEHNVLILVDFAIALMTILDQINRESFQRFKLRMGEEILYCYQKANVRQPVTDSCLRKPQIQNKRREVEHTT